MIVYCALNKINGKRYVGSTIKTLELRIKQHLSSSKMHFGNALRKYGVQSFELSIIDTAEDISTLREKERYWIEKFECRVPRGYNLTSGGEVGGVANKGRTAWNKGKSITEEQRLKMCEMRKGQPSPMLGKKHSQATKDKIAAKAIGRKYSDETRKKVSASLVGNQRTKGRKLSLEHRQKVSLSLIGNRRAMNVSEEGRLRRLRTGKKMPPEARAKISASLIGNKRAARQKEFWVN
jgi:group I intron endonuclease